MLLIYVRHGISYLETALLTNGLILPYEQSVYRSNDLGARRWTHMI